MIEPSRDDVVALICAEIMKWQPATCTDPKVRERELYGFADALIRFFGVHYAARPLPKLSGLPGLPGGPSL
ncbi:MAG TPA: hypothetical protein VGB79_01815 [Allosphingosinicella sp.]|jgi:hypothetical protein